MKKIPLLLMGCGGVGRQLIQHIVSCRSLHAKHGVHLRIVGVCDSKSSVIASDVFDMELDDTFLIEVCRAKLQGSPLFTLGGIGDCQVFSNSETTRKLLDIAILLGRTTGLVFVDCSASSETIGVLNQVADLGCCIVLANKKPLTSTLENYDKLFSCPRHIRHESTAFLFSDCPPKTLGCSGDVPRNLLNMIDYAVGAGLPVIASLNRILSSGDPIHRIVGSVSGTLGYVMSQLEDGKSFSEVVRSAKSLGYTEPDPRDDLSGMDVARKALILVRLLGWRINLDSIKIDSLYPEEMGANIMSVDDFLSKGILLLDKDIKERVERASFCGNVLRYVCMIEGSRCEVGIQELPKSSALGRLRGSDNVLEIYSRCYGQQPLVIQGAGAGNDTTAVGVLADILDVQDLFRDEKMKICT